MGLTFWKRKGASQPVREILTDASDLHRQLALYYQRRSKETDEEMVGLLFEKLAERELKAAEGLQGYANEGHAEALGTWLPWREFPHVELDMVEEPPDDIDGIVQAVDRFDRRLEDMYRHLQHVSTSAGLHELSDDLRQLFHQRQMELSRVVTDAEIA